MDISNFNKADVLAALFNGAKTQGLGFLHYRPNHTMDREEAEGLLKNQGYFDYHEGRVMKVYLDADELQTSLYNRDNGVGKAERLIEAIKEK